MPKLENDLERLQATIDAFCAYAAAMPDRAASGQTWGVREVLAHLVYHHEAYVAQARALAAGRDFTLPVGRFKDMNAEAVIAQRDVPMGELVRRLRTADRQLREIVLQPGGAELTLQIKQGSKRWPLPDLICAVEAHVRRHHQNLIRAAKIAS
jgi:hypothetical protein